MCAELLFLPEQHLEKQNKGGEIKEIVRTQEGDRKVRNGEWGEGENRETER